MAVDFLDQILHLHADFEDRRISLLMISGTCNPYRKPLYRVLEDLQRDYVVQIRQLRRDALALDALAAGVA